MRLEPDWVTDSPESTAFRDTFAASAVLASTASERRASVKSLLAWLITEVAASPGTGRRTVARAWNLVGWPDRAAKATPPANRGTTRRMRKRFPIARR